ncbi:MAG TPA: sugar phosphate nucleotidyltransferase, partial [Clostridia bacterium]|nr:sugar phosphate nucleotidyltransferase [Clostridia bacterium]
MSDVVGIISTCRSSDLLMGLTKERPIAAMPFGGRYRLLDFPLSNMVNTGIRTVGIIVPYNCRPVLDHLKIGKGWSLDRKMGGLFILPSDDLQVLDEGFQLKDLASNIDFLKKATAEQVILACSNIVYNTGYKEALRFHQKAGAGVTLIYHEGETVSGDNEDSLFLEAGADGRLLSLCPELPLEGENRGGCFLDTVIIERKLLLRLIGEFEATETMDLLTAVEENLQLLKVYAYPFRGYVGRINSVQSYFKCSMDLLVPEVRKELFYNIHTKTA